MISSVDSYRPVDLFAAPREGLQRGMSQAMTASEKIADGEVSPDNMVSLMVAGVSMKANATVMRTADKMLGAFLDSFA